MTPLPPTWRRVRLGEVCEINPRLPADLRLQDHTPVSFVPMASVDETSGEIAAPEERPYIDAKKGFTPFAEDDVLFAKITPSMENGKAAIARDLRNGVGFGSTEFHVLRCTDLILPEFVFYFVRQTRFRSWAKSAFIGSAGQQRVPQSFLARIPFLLPTIPEQIQIVGVLNQFHAVRRQRSESLALFESLERALYFEMFVEGGSGNVQTRTIESLAKQTEGTIRTGPFGSQLKHEEFTEEGVPVLAIDNIVTNRFAWPDEPRCLPAERYAQFRRFRVYPGDLIFTIMGTAGRVAVAPDDLPECMSTKHLCVVTLDDRMIRPWFAWAAVRFDPHVAKAVAAAGHGAVMTGWNIGIVKDLSIPVPPLEEQEEFERRLLELNDVALTAETSGTLLEQLAGSLESGAFNGELTQRWRESRRAELEELSPDRQLGLVTEKPVRVPVPEAAPAERPVPGRPARHWLMDQLSPLQGQVYDALGEWKGTLIPSEYLDLFLEEWPIDHLEDRHDQVLRALDQLAGLGLVARVSLPNDTGEYVSGYRTLREGELSRDDDLERLGAPA